MATSSDAVVAVVERRGKWLHGAPLFEPRGRRITLDRDKRARVGDLVLVTGRGKLLRRLGSPDVARDVVEGLMYDAGLRRRFDPAVDRAARHAEPARVARRDLTGMPTFTVDPPTARDFDDAISAERVDGVLRIWVHIADVAAHVPPGGPVDREAQRRALSVYVPGAVEPMLPEALSNDACSLQPGVDRLAVTAELDVDGDRVVRSAFYRSVIRSDARLDYPQVDRIFAGTERAEGVWAVPLEVAREASAALGARRGGLDVQTSEPAFAFDRDGHAIAVEREAQTESHRLIEHLMVAANEAVAGLLEDRGLPALYRNHENPDNERVQRLVAQLAALDVPTQAVSDQLSRTQAAEAVNDISRVVREYAAAHGRGRIGFTVLVLRALQQAVYAPENAGHAGLRSARYCHFTSPIRRYPDLVVHRSLLAAIGAGEQAPARGGLAELGAWCSLRERDAMAIERRADDVVRAFVLEQRLFADSWEQEFEGEVTGVISAGAFVAFEEFEGMLPSRTLPGGRWDVDELGVTLGGPGTMRVGDPVVVQVRALERARGRVTLGL